jgi:hypothetical protein
MSISNIYIDQGSDFSTTVTINDSNGDLLDLFGYTANAQIRKTYSSTLYVDFPTTFSEDRSTGEITLDLSSTATSQLNPGLYVYDLIIYDINNTITRVVEGIINVSPSVTR